MPSIKATNVASFSQENPSFLVQKNTAFPKFGRGIDGDVAVSGTKNLNTMRLGTDPARTRNCDAPSAVVTAISGRTITIGALLAPAVAADFFAGDCCILINMQGSAASHANAGVYEFVKLAANGSGSTLTLDHDLEKTFGETDNSDLTDQKIVIMRLPEYGALTMPTASDIITCTAWDGAQGGISALFALSINCTGGGKIHADQKGFRGATVGSGVGEGEQGGHNLTQTAAIGGASGGSVDQTSGSVGSATGDDAISKIFLGCGGSAGSTGTPGAPGAPGSAGLPGSSGNTGSTGNTAGAGNPGFGGGGGGGAYQSYGSNAFPNNSAPFAPNAHYTAFGGSSAPGISGGAGATGYPNAALNPTSGPDYAAVCGGGSGGSGGSGQATNSTGGVGGSGTAGTSGGTGGAGGTGGTGGAYGSGGRGGGIVLIFAKQITELFCQSLGQVGQTYTPGVAGDSGISSDDPVAAALGALGDPGTPNSNPYGPSQSGSPGSASTYYIVRAPGAGFHVNGTQGGGGGGGGGSGGRGGVAGSGGRGGQGGQGGKGGHGGGGGSGAPGASGGSGAAGQIIITVQTLTSLNGTATATAAAVAPAAGGAGSALPLSPTPRPPTTPAPTPAPVGGDGWPGVQGATGSSGSAGADGFGGGGGGGGSSYNNPAVSTATTYLSPLAGAGSGGSTAVGPGGGGAPWAFINPAQPAATHGVAGSSGSGRPGGAGGAGGQHYHAGTFVSSGGAGGGAGGGGSGGSMFKGSGTATPIPYSPGGIQGSGSGGGGGGSGGVGGSAGSGGSGGPGGGGGLAGAPGSVGSGGIAVVRGVGGSSGAPGNADSSGAYGRIKVIYFQQGSTYASESADGANLFPLTSPSAYKESL